jgi:3,4-dihydroxy 2-butanone 4-phosphate synthase/GTP cyclohydrolase II
VKARVPLTPHPNDHNLAYLLTKRDRMGHDLPDLEGSEMNGSAPRAEDAL